ncbi:MAG: NAD(P)-dependent oxidoreductase [Planctomycetota bacterium]
MPDIKQVMVTGASGKLGGPLSEALLAGGYRVIGVDRRLPIGVDGVEEVQADVGDGAAMEELVSRSDAVIHLASCKEDRENVIPVSFQGTFNLLDAAMRTKKPKRVILASGDAVNGIYFNPQPVPIREDMPMVAYPGYYAFSKVVEETMFQQYFFQAGVPTVICRMSWIQAEDDILTHLTVAGETFGVPVWTELMDEDERARFADGRDAAVALLHPNGKPLRRHIVAVEDCVESYLLALKTEGIEGETYHIAMNDPFDYREAAAYAAQRLGIEVLELVDPVGQDFSVDTTKARYQLGYQPQYDIRGLIDHAIEFRQSGGPRRERSGYKG